MHYQICKLKNAMEFKEEDFLNISGIQHFSFCRRQWALIHIENQWEENNKTMEGILMHERAHDYNLSEKRKNIIIKRGLRVFSANLGVSGDCDVVEFHKSQKGISLHNEEGLWEPIPIEYKRGSPKYSNMDELQLCLEAMCLEEMLCCTIHKGYLFYGEIKRRVEVDFCDDLRIQVKEILKEMHLLYSKKYTPKVKQTKICKNCSLNELCLPKLQKIKSPSLYVKETIGYEKDT